VAPIARKERAGGARTHCGISAGWRAGDPGCPA